MKGSGSYAFEASILRHHPPKLACLGEVSSDSRRSGEARTITSVMYLDVDNNLERDRSPAELYLLEVLPSFSV